MKMLAFQLILLLIVTLFIGRTEISLVPFHFHMEHWRTVIAMFLFFIAYQLFVYDLKSDWKKEAEKSEIVVDVEE